jgi:hypothetical protein
VLARGLLQRQKRQAIASLIHRIRLVTRARIAGRWIIESTNQLIALLELRVLTVPRHRLRFLELRCRHM